MQNGRSRLVLVFALILGLVTAGLVWNYTQRLQRDAQQAAERSRIEMVPVVVAKQDIPVRTELAESMVEVKQIPGEARHPQAATSVKDVVGKVVKLPISADEQVISSKFAAQRAESGLTFIIPPNKRAVSINVSEVIGSGGLILPGDSVDVIGVFDKETMGKDMAAYVLQNVQVLAVAQLLQGDAVQEESATTRVEKSANAAVNPNQSKAATTDQAQEKAQPQPKARSVTLSVSPEEAERLVLAEKMGELRLALRPVKDLGTVDLPEATLSTIRNPLQADTAVITAVSISPTNARAGDTLKVQITVKNTSNAPLKSQAPGPEFTYVQGQTFYSQNFPSQDGTYRVAMGFDGTSSAPLPYRWGLGADLPAGASTTVTGYVKLTHDLKPTNFWAGLVREPSTVVQNNVGTTLVTVAPTDVAIVSVDVANVRSGPTVDASVIAQIKYGTALPILGQAADWYKIKLPDGREGYVAAGWIVGSSSRGG